MSCKTSSDLIISQFAAFPLAYAFLLPSLYMPIMIMLAALIFRGIAFEFRFKSEKHRFIWNLSFHLGSVVTAFMQGLILGTFINGYDQINPQAHEQVVWFTPFSCTTGIFVVFGYAMLGANWLIIKSEEVLQDMMFRYSKVLLILVSFGVLTVSLWTPMLAPMIFERWFTMPNILYLAPIPLATGIAISYNWYCLQARYEKFPFFMSIVIFICSFFGLCVSLYPYIIPHKVTFWEAAAPASSQQFVLIGFLIMFPFLIGYTVYAYSVFKGKVVPEGGYTEEDLTEETLAAIQEESAQYEAPKEPDERTQKDAQFPEEAPKKSPKEKSPKSKASESDKSTSQNKTDVHMSYDFSGEKPKKPEGSDDTPDEEKDDE